MRDAEKRRRRERRIPAFLAARGGRGNAGHGSGRIGAIAGPVTSPSRRVERTEAVRTMETALAGLPEDQREVLGERRYLLGAIFDQIAAATGRTRGAVRGSCAIERAERARCDGAILLVLTSDYLCCGVMPSDVPTSSQNSHRTERAAQIRRVVFDVGAATCGGVVLRTKRCWRSTPTCCRS